MRALGERARRELEQQIVLQTTEDGVNREQAFEYAAFVYDFFAVAERCAAVAGRPSRPPIWTAWRPCAASSAR